MSDWEIVPNEASTPALSSLSSSDWEIIPNAVSESTENYGTSLGLAIPRMLVDAGKGSFNFLNKVPGYLRAAPEEIANASFAMQTHPYHAIGQGLAGSQELINSLAQFPKTAVDYATNRLHLLPESAPDFAKHLVPEDTTQAINALFGSPQYAGEELIRGIPRNALNILGAGKVASLLNPLNLTKKNIIKNVLESESKNKEKHSLQYDNLWDKSKNSGYDNLPNVVNQIDFKTLKKYSSDKPLEALEDLKNNPSNETAHSAKSDLLKIQRKLKTITTKNSAERKHSKAVNEAIDVIQNNMFKNKAGEVDKNLLTTYKNLNKSYRENVIPYTTNKAIQKFKAGEIGDENLINALNRDPFRVKKGSAHRALGFRNALEPLMTVKGAALGTGGLGGGLYIYDKFFNDKDESQNVNPFSK